MSFKSLVSVVSEQRQEIKQALALFQYFDTWEPNLIAECCRVSSIVEFPPHEIVLGPDTGNSHAVYFILEGICKMVQNLYVTFKKGSREKKKIYKLYKHFPSKDFNFETKNEVYVSKLFNQNFHEQTEFKNGNYNKEKLGGTGSNPNKIFVSHTKAPRNSAANDDEGRAEMNDEKQNELGIFCSEEADEEILPKKNKSDAESSDPLNSEPGVGPKSNENLVGEASKTKEETTYEMNYHLMVLEECKKRREDMSRAFKKFTPCERSKNTKCFFLQIGFLLKGACFGLEKPENESFIMTATAVKCLKIPRRFLLQHNPCNIWNRIRLFYSLRLPKEDELFEYFRTDRMWTEKKKTLTEDIISLKNLPRNISASEVPYSIRLADSQWFFH